MNLSDDSGRWWGWRSFSRDGGKSPISLFPRVPAAGPYPFLLMSMPPRDGREVRKLQHARHTPCYQRSHFSVHRRVIPTGTATADPRVPGRWGRRCGREQEGIPAGSGPRLSTTLQPRCTPRRVSPGVFCGCWERAAIRTEWRPCLHAWSVGRDSVKASNPFGGQRRLKGGSRQKGAGRAF